VVPCGIVSRVATITLDLGIVDRARYARTRLVMEAVQPLRDEAGSPFAHRLRRDSELPRNHLVGITRRAGEHDAGSQRQSLGRRSPPRQAPQRFLFSLAQSENRQRTTHDLSSSDKIMNLMRISDSEH